MSNRGVPTLMVVAVALLLAGGEAARASDAISGEIAAGYSMVRDSDADQVFPIGWFVSGGASLRDWLALTAEISYNSKTSTDSIGESTATTSLNVRAFLGGARLSTHGRVSVFGQILVGVASETADVKTAGPGVSIDVSASQTNPCYQPGVGVEIGVGSHIRVRAAANVRLIRDAAATSKETQFVAGIVYRFRR